MSDVLSLFPCIFAGARDQKRVNISERSPVWDATRHELTAIRAPAGSFNL